MNTQAWGLADTGERPAWDERESAVDVPIVMRGVVINGNDQELHGRHGELRFRAPDLHNHLESLHLKAPSELADLYSISFDDIVEYLHALGKQLSLVSNAHLREAFDAACQTSALPESILKHQYERLPSLFRTDTVREMAQRHVGIPYLEGWVAVRSGSRSVSRARVRAFGARSVHVIAGNSPLIGAVTIIRNAITRSDAIIKAPSNDLLTASAIARTMTEMDASHPLTRHLTVAYWKGGDRRVEPHIYDPRYIEKVVAWGGYAGIKHIVGFLAPGIDLITLNPKLSSTIIAIGPSTSDGEIQTIAERLAADVGTMNQEGCFSARVVYVVCGTDSAGRHVARKLARGTYDALQKLPSTLSTPAKVFDQELKAHISALRFCEEEFEVFGKAPEGVVIVSHNESPVDFSHLLACRVANIVPVDDLETAIESVSSYTQTVGIYPESLKKVVRDRLAMQGAQRLVSLGLAPAPQLFTPQDGIEPLRRMCKWIVEERWPSSRT